MRLAGHISWSTPWQFAQQYPGLFSRHQQRPGPKGRRDLACRGALGSIKEPLEFEEQESSFL